MKSTATLLPLLLLTSSTALAFDLDDHLPTTTITHDTVLGVNFEGDWPVSCEIQITYTNGSHGGTSSCKLRGDGSHFPYGAIDDANGEAGCSAGSINNINHSDSFVTVELIGDLRTCAAEGGLRIDSVWGDGPRSKDFDVRRWTSNGLPGVTSALARWAEPNSNGDHGVVELGVSDFDRANVIQHMLWKFESDVKKSSSSGSREQDMLLVRATQNVPNLCDLYANPVAIITDNDQYISRWSGDSHAVGRNAPVVEFDMVCGVNNSVRFIADDGRYLRAGGSSISYSTDGTAPTTEFVNFVDQDGIYLMTPFGTLPWWRAADASNNYRIRLTSSPNSATRIFHIVEQ